VPEPPAHDARQAVAIEAIVAPAALAAYLNEARFLEHLEVTRRRRPAVLEARREVARGELAAEVAEQDQHVPPRLVRQRDEDRVDLFERRGSAFHALRAHGRCH
jgi:hypothetical protein